MNCFLISVIVSYISISFGEELAILPNLKQYWVIEGSTLNLTCIHNGTLASQEYQLSFWKRDIKVQTGNGVSVHTYAFGNTQDIERTIRTLVITKSDVQFNDGVTYKCILGHNLTSCLAEAVIEVRVLQFLSASYDIPESGEESVEIIPPVQQSLVLECKVRGINQSDTSFTVTTEWLQILDGKERLLQNSSKYTIFTENRTLEISNPVRQDAGEYRCVLVFNKGDMLFHQEVRSPPIDVNAVPKIETCDKDKSMVQGDTLELRCTASGFPKPTVTWMKDGQTLNQTERIHPTDERLRISNLQLNDTGAYQCVASHWRYLHAYSAKVHVEVKSITDVKSGGRGYNQELTWVYVFFSLCLMHCGLYAEPKL